MYSKLSAQDGVGPGTRLGELPHQGLDLRDGVLVGLYVVLQTTQPRLQGEDLLVVNGRNGR